MPTLGGSTIDWEGWETCFLYFEKHSVCMFPDNGKLLHGKITVCTRYNYQQDYSKVGDFTINWRLACPFLFPNCGVGNKLKTFDKDQKII